MTTYVLTFLFFLLWFLLDFILAGGIKTFSIHIVRFFLYMTVIKKGSPYAIVLCGFFMLLESFVLHGIFGLEVCITIPIITLLYIFKDTFDNHWLLQILLAISCYMAHGYILKLMENLI